MKIEHSTDDGTTWAEVDINPCSVIAHRLVTVKTVVDDGVGNLYRKVNDE